MAEENSNSQEDKKIAKKQLNIEKKQLKDEQKKNKKEVKERAKQISSQEADLNEGSKSSALATIIVTVLIVIFWVALLGILIKLDVGGFGTEVLTPILKDVPVINKILPNRPNIEDEDEYFGYASLKEAVERIQELELELEKIQISNGTSQDEIIALKTEIERLLTFEANQVEFQQTKNQFYEEVVYAEKGPGEEAFQKYYESMDPTTAELIYRQVVQQLEESTEILDYASTYSSMKPKEAAGIFEEMTDNLSLVARILEVMSIEERGAIIGVMDPEIAAMVTKIMEPSG